MKKVFTFFILAISLSSVALSGCAAKQQYQDDSYYDRANSASSESLRGLDKE